MLKIKHQRTADCVVAGFRWYKGGKDTLVGSLLLGLYDDDGVLHHVGVCVGVQADRARRARRACSQPLRERARGPSVEGLGRVARRRGDARSACPARRSRWNRGKDLSWEPLRLELRLRGLVRPPAGHAVSPRHALQALAARQAAERLPLRSARGDTGVRDRADLRRRSRIIVVMRGLRCSYWHVRRAVATSCSISIRSPRAATR